VVVRDRRRRGEVALAEFYCSLEEGVPQRVALAVFGFLQRRVFPREQTPISYPETYTVQNIYFEIFCYYN
jgi:hypothetical protein